MTTINQKNGDSCPRSLLLD